MNVGDELIFNTYGYELRGTFVDRDGDSLLVNMTKDFIRENIGTIQRINVGFLVEAQNQPPTTVCSLPPPSGKNTPPLA